MGVASCVVMAMLSAQENAVCLQDMTLLPPVRPQCRRLELSHRLRRIHCGVEKPGEFGKAREFSEQRHRVSGDDECSEDAGREKYVRPAVGMRLVFEYSMIQLCTFKVMRGKGLLFVRVAFHLD